MDDYLNTYMYNEENRELIIIKKESIDVITIPMIDMPKQSSTVYKYFKVDEYGNYLIPKEAYDYPDDSYAL